MRPSTTLRLALITLTAVVVSMVAVPANAITYDVNRSWGGGSASLVGTVDVALGSYTITNMGANPFMNVSLTLTVNGNSFALDHADTSLIFGTGQFFIDATSSSLIFDTATADGSNPADLQFFDPTNTARYVIGYNGIPGFEAGYTPTDGVIGFLTLPVVFGTAASVPEAGSTLGLLAIGLLGIGIVLQKSSRRQAKIALRPGP